MPDSPRRRQSSSGELVGSDREIEDYHRSWFVKHRSAITSVAVVVVLVGVITAAFLITRNLGNVTVADASSSAPPPSSSAAPSTSAPPTTTAPSTPAPPQKVTVTDATVVTVLAPGRWTISAEKNFQITIVANAATKYPKDKGASDIKKGTVITVTGTQSGSTLVAATVTIGKKKN